MRSKWNSDKAGRLTAVKKKKEKRKKDEYDKKNKTKDEKLTYPLDEDDLFHQYKEEMDPFLLQ